MSARDTIKAQFQQVTVEQHRKLARFSDDLKLLESGLGSLSFSVIVTVIRWSMAGLMRRYCASYFRFDRPQGMLDWRRWEYPCWHSPDAIFRLN